MPPRVAGLFGKAVRPKAPIEAEQTIINPVEVDDKDHDNKYDQLLTEQVKIRENRPKYIIGAIEKAEERREMAENVKQIKLEKEIQQLEKDQVVLRFNTDDLSNITEEQIGNPENTHSFQINNQVENEEEEINEMKERYLCRLEEKDILKLNLSKEEIDQIVNWGNGTQKSNQ